MKNILKTCGTFALILIAQNFYSQAKEAPKSVENKLKFYGDNTVNNEKTKIVTFTGNATVKNSNSISFDSAEKIVYNGNTSVIEIYKPKNFKIIKADAVTKKLKPNDEGLVIYNIKENSVIL